MERLHHCVFDIHAHLVLVTKHRRKTITKHVLRRLDTILRATCRKWGVRVAELNGEADHVHLLLATPPSVQPSKLVNNLKTVSSRLLRKEFPALRTQYTDAAFWSRSYCYVSCGGAPLAIIKAYIETQDAPK